MELYTVNFDSYGEVCNVQYLAPDDSEKWAIEALCDSVDMTEAEWREHSDNEDYLQITKLSGGEWRAYGTNPENAYGVSVTCNYAPAPSEATK